MDTAPILERLAAQDAELRAIRGSVERSERYFKITLWITVICLALPLVAALVMVPLVLGSFTSSMGGGDTAAQLELLQELLAE